MHTNRTESASSAKKTLEVRQLLDLAAGAAFMGTGGGGDPYIGRLMAEQAIREFGPPEIIPVGDVPDDFTVVAAAMVGAPTVMMEKGGSGEDIEHAIRKHAQHTGIQPQAIVPIEIGGINSMLPIIAACRLGLPLVDCDGMGRAFPEIQMVTFYVGGVSPTPVVIVNEHLETAIIESHDAKRAEDLVRAAAIQMGLSVLFCGYAMNGKQLKANCVPNSLSLALEIGSVIRRAASSADPIEMLLEFLRGTEEYNRCKVLFEGKVVDVLRETRRGFSIGNCTITSGDRPDTSMVIQFQNENLLASLNGRTVAIVPDLICIVDQDTIEPITAESLKFGQRVKVVGLSAAKIMRTEEALAVFGPRAFGIDEDFVRLEDIHDDI